MTSALASEELARLIFSAHQPANIRRIKYLLSCNKGLWDSLAEPVKASVESALYDTDYIEFSVYGEKAWSLGF
jgi:hypothetical protein